MTRESGFAGAGLRRGEAAACGECRRAEMPFSSWHTLWQCSSRSVAFQRPKSVTRVGRNKGYLISVVNTASAGSGDTLAPLAAGPAVRDPVRFHTR